MGLRLAGGQMVFPCGGYRLNKSRTHRPFLLGAKHLYLPVGLVGWEVVVSLFSTARVIME